VTTDQVLLGVGLIVALAVGSQVLASRLKIPALILLLPAGFTAGAITTDVNPQRLLGATFQPLVSLAVAVILYDAGMSLDLRKLRGHTRRIVVRLIVMGVPVTLAFGAVFAGLLLGMSRQAAVMTGTILVVSGPTVVGPLLGFVRPAERVQRVLSWEGSLIDPVGGILGAVVFHAVVASTRRGLGYQFAQFLLGIGVGLAGERLFTGWMAPRGIIAAATASTFSAGLVAQHVRGAAKILPVTFLVIVITVAVYGLTAVPVARRLGVTRPARTRPLLVGGDDWVIDLGRALRSQGLDVLMWAGFDEQRQRIKQAGLELAPGELLAAATGGAARLEGVTAVLLLTGEDDFNALGSTVLQGSVEGSIYRLGARQPGHGVVAPYTGGETLFDSQLTRYELDRRYADGARICVQPADGGVNADGTLLFLVRADGRLAPVTRSGAPEPEPGDIMILLDRPLPAPVIRRG
jgi:hypothetical protein